ncbi:T3SS effector HopA1 family protein [Lacihabitans lacunae]|uniref:T3SS effector HopA1 family protein n=1 Tax=Lacihabitans lacunae TaxID=1028214 RepID=A0ABV7YWR1_9BACT
MNIEKIYEIFQILDVEFATINWKTISTAELISYKIKFKKKIYKIYVNPNLNLDINYSFDELVKIKKANLRCLEKYVKIIGNQIFWNKGWQFEDSSRNFSQILGQYLLFKGGEYRLVSPMDFISKRKNTSDGTEVVDVRVCLLEGDENSDWFFINGENILGENSILRIYFNFIFTPEESGFDKICIVIARLVDELNNRVIPFKLKLSPFNGNRSDSAVLYFQRTNMYAVFYVINKLFNQNQARNPNNTFHKFLKIFSSKIFRSQTETYFNPASILNTNIPLFTKKLFNGIGFAEDIGQGKESFGENISEVIASLYQKYKLNTTEFELSKELSQIGLNHDELYRNPYTSYPYDFSLLENPSNEKPFNIEIKRFTYFKYAFFAGKLIVKNVILTFENGKRNLNWISPEMNDINDFSYKFVDNSFLSGRLGIAFFLFSLFEKIPNEIIFKSITIDILNQLSVNEFEGFELDCFNYLEKKTNGLSAALNTPVFIDSFNIDSIVRSIKRRKVYDNEKNIAINPTIKNGFSGIGLHILNDSEYFPQYLDNILAQIMEDLQVSSI